MAMGEHPEHAAPVKHPMCGLTVGPKRTPD